MKRLLLGVLAALCLLPAAARAQVLFSTPPSCAAPPGNTTLPVLNCGLGDIKLFRDAANVLALRNGGSAQSFNVYGSYTDASNRDYLSITKAAGGDVNLSAQGAGTGLGGAIVFGVPLSGGAGVAATNVWKITQGNLVAVADNSYDIGANGANRPRNLYIGGNATIGASGVFQISARGVYSAPVDGNFLLQNAAQTSFGLLQFGGTTSSFPALKRSGSSIDFRNGDDTAYTQIKVDAVQTISGTVSALATCNSGTDGMRDFVTDATVTASGNFGAAVVGSGANHVPVYCDATSWKIG